MHLIGFYYKNTVSRLLMMDSRSVRNIEVFAKINLGNNASHWLLL